MHGRVKVKTTEEQERSRKEEKEKKLNIFRDATNAIFEKRSSKVHDQETLRLISDVLLKVPDWFTLWNYRREIILYLKMSSVNDSADNLALDDYTKLLNKELDLTRHCLIENPKSYSTWHHRCWVMLQFPTPDWNKELELCSAALLLDERNFHCWDYRRFVVDHAGISADDEFEFTSKKLTANFSNYSSWHYRSTLLHHMTEEHACKENKDGLPDCTVKEEMDLIHNAVFTDPNDQSPWFYHRWLLNRGPKKTYFREVYINRRIKRLILVFAKPEIVTALNAMEVKLEIRSQKGITIGQFMQKSHPATNEDCPPNSSVEEQPLKWISALEGGVSSVWWLEIPTEWLDKENSIEATIQPDSTINVVFRCQVNPSAIDSLVRVSLDSNRMFNHMISLESKEVLLQELSTVRELYELEPENKWVLLTMLSLLRLTNPQESMTETKEIIHNLVKVDPLRTNYYSDLLSRYNIENEVIDVYQKSLRSLRLPDCGLSRIYCLEWLPLLTIIDLSKNNLETLPSECAYLVCLVEFYLDDNKLSNVASLSQLITLKRLTLRNNSIITFDGLEPILCCPQLLHLDITGNGVAKLLDLTDRVADHPTAKMHAQPLEILYDKKI